jgi:hypothetical protein
MYKKSSANDIRLKAFEQIKIIFFTFLPYLFFIGTVLGNIRIVEIKEKN